MTIQVIGFEGSSDGALVSWGAAALRIGDELVNPTTGARVPWEKDEIKRLEEEGALQRLPTPMKIADAHAESHLVVLHVARFEAYGKAFTVDTGRGAFVKNSNTAAGRFYLFENVIAFEQCARQLCAQIVGAILYNEPAEDDRDRLLEAALTLNSRDPYANALFVYYAPRPKAARETVIGHLSDHERRQFDQTLQDLNILSATKGKTDKSEYVLKYEKGLVPEKGGLNIQAASRLLSAMKSVDASIRKLMKREYAFLDEPPPMHVQELVAASAEFHFAAVGDALGDQLARLIELRYLERALEGDVDALSDDPSVRAALLKIVNLDDATELTHKPVGETKLRDLSPLGRLEGEITKHEPIALLGYQSGLIREGERIELTIFPGRRLTVPGFNNGEGQLPLGVEFLSTSRDFLFRPMIYTIVRHVDERGREAHFLQGVKDPAKAGGVVTALPSAIVPGAFIYRLSLKTQLANLTLKGTPLWEQQLAVEKVGTLVLRQDSSRTAHDWMHKFQTACLEYELQPSRPIHRIRREKSTATSIGRVLVALSSLGGEARVYKVVAAINEAFGTNVRVNNTRREALMHHDLISFTEDQKGLLLTDRGQKYLKAYIAAGGLQSAEPDT